MKYKKILKIMVICYPIWWSVVSCSKLNSAIYDKASVFWQTPDQIAAGVAPAYTNLRQMGDYWNTMPVLEGSTDDFIVPTRGGDWNDLGVWDKIWKHTWDPNYDKFEGVWQFIYGGISNVNTIIATLNLIKLEPTELNAIEAELKTVRAYYYYLAIDLWGNIPIQDSNVSSLSSLKTKKRADVFAYIEKELKENLPYLTKDVNPKTYGRATFWLAQAILAKLYLNAEVYTGTQKWSDCIAACDSILNSGLYSLEPDFFTNFKIANDNSRENIFVIPFDTKAGLGNFWLQYATLHYNSDVTFGLDFGGSNGMCFPTGFYNLFDSNDLRRKIFIVGQQYVNQIPLPENKQYDEATNPRLPLYFDPNIVQFSSPDPRQRMVGARCGKWEFDKTPGNNSAMSNDFAVFRLADIILMKAEAQLRSGDKTSAISTINQKINGISIRGRVNMPDFGNELNLDTLLNERGRELAWEGHRRSDLIRFGHFTDARSPEKAVSEPFRTLYPIPEPEISKNPYLEQNPGYPK